MLVRIFVTPLDISLLLLKKTWEFIIIATTDRISLGDLIFHKPLLSKIKPMNNSSNNISRIGWYDSNSDENFDSSAQKCSPVPGTPALVMFLC